MGLPFHECNKTKIYTYIGRKCDFFSNGMHVEKY